MLTEETTCRDPQVILMVSLVHNRRSADTHQQPQITEEKNTSVCHITCCSSFYSLVCSSPGLLYLPKPAVGDAPQIYEPFQFSFF